MMKREYFYNFEKLAYVKGDRPEGCILCQLRDKNPQVIDLSLYEDPLFIVSLNLYPFNPGHLMLFPKRHIQDIREYTQSESRRIKLLLDVFLDILDMTHNPFGYNIGYNMGLSAGASIIHLHCHIIPRYPREIGLADLIGGKRVLVERPDQTRKKIKKAIKQKKYLNRLKLPDHE